MHLVHRKPAEACDVLIIGAGPAGSATALKLMQRGARSLRTPRVTMIDAGHFERFRIGESLPPDARKLLDELQVLPEFLDAAHQPCWGSLSSWGNEQIGFNDFAVNIHGHGWHLERNRFDALLARSAAERGVSVHTGCRLRQVTDGENGGYRVELQNADHAARSIEARYVVDASGQSAVFAQSVGVRRNYDDRLVCIAGIFELQQSSLIDQRTLLESAACGWWYCARINAAQAIVSLTTDPATARALSLNTLGSWFGHLAQTRHLGHRLTGGKLDAEGLRPWAAPSYRLQHFSGRDWLAVGDSALCFDPITAQGIHKALSMGISAGDALMARLDGKAFDFSAYEQQVEQRHSEYLQLRRSLYANEQRWPDHSFWSARQRFMAPSPAHHPRAIDAARRSRHTAG